MWHRDVLFLSLVVIGVAFTGTRLFQAQHLKVDHKPLSQATKADLRQVADKVNQEFQKHWTEAKLSPTPRASNLAIIRRMSLALTGTLPSLEEIRVVENLKEEKQLSWWIERLLNDRRFSDYMAERLARSFVGTSDGPFLFYRRRRFVIWLSDLIEKKTPYNELVRQLISDEGVWTTDPSVNFVTVTATENTENQPDPIRLAGRTSRAFLAMRIDCLQCHDDHLGNIQLGTKGNPRMGTQKDFHKLAAFFASTKTSFLGVRDDKKKQMYRYKFLNKKKKEPVKAETPFLGALLKSEGTLRERLAGWITDKQNRPFARATVNRIWAIVFGRPLVDPVDNIPLHRPFPPALETLADDFVAHDYDLRRLIRIIVLSQPFRIDSRADFEITDDHEQNWAAFRLTRLRAEQVAGALIQSCSTKTIDANSHIFDKLSRHFREVEFVKRYGDLGEDEFEDRGGTITQRLLMMNGELLQALTKRDLVGNASTRIAVLAEGDERAIDTAYLCVLTRHPSKRELEHFRKRIDRVTGNERSRRLEDLFWVLLNSSEFSWNH